jgi:Tol biopolymer transport system component
MGRTLTRGGALLAISIVALSAQLAIGAPSDSRTVLVSRADGENGQASDGILRKAWISGNGRHVAFLSTATNIGEVEPTLSPEIYIRDVAKGKTRPLSVVLGGVLPGHVSLSANGRYIAYDISNSFEGEDAESTPSPVPHDFVAKRGQIYVFDQLTGRHTLVSRAAGRRGQIANRLSSEPAISANGRFVAFVSPATNLTADHPGQDGRGEPQNGIYVRDLRINRTTLVSRANGPRGAPPNLSSSEPSISANGRFVAFTSKASLGVPGLPDEGERLAVFRRDLVRGKTSLVSRWGRGDGTVGFASAPSISANGQRVAFYGIAVDPPGTPVHGPSDDPLAQAEHGGHGPVGEGAVFVRDLAARRSHLVSRRNGPEGRPLEGSNQPSISADGRFVAFQSSSATLSPQLPRRPLNALLRDTDTDRTTVIAKEAEQPEISANGRFVVFIHEGLSGNAFRYARLLSR